MKKLGQAALLALAAALVGCSAGEVSFDQQTSKKEALQKAGDSVPAPPREERPQ